MKRVVITGYGLVSPIGNNVKTAWDNIIHNNSGIRSYLNDPILQNSSPYSLALVKDFEFEKWKVPHATSRLNAFLSCAVQQAIQHSNLNIQKINPQDFGICLGNMVSNNTKVVEFVRQSASLNYKNINRLSMLHILTNIPAATLNVKYKFRGPSLTVSTACASGLSAVVQGYKWIKNEQAKIAVVGGIQDVYNPLYLNSSIRLQAMTTKKYQTPEQSSRPFDKNRSGFVLGQGSGILILEQYQHAKNRNAAILGQILGYGYTSDGYHLVKPQQSGQGQFQAMQKALKMAKISPDQIDNFNAHATSTKAGDEIQANSIKRLLGNNNALKPSISAFKSYLGHTFGAAGAIELILGIQSMQKKICPKIRNLSQIQIQGLNYSTQTRQQDINIMLKNSFGFGGINVCMLIKKSC